MNINKLFAVIVIPGLILTGFPQGSVWADLVAPDAAPPASLQPTKTDGAPQAKTAEAPAAAQPVFEILKGFNPAMDTPLGPPDSTEQAVTDAAPVDDALTNTASDSQTVTYTTTMSTGQAVTVEAVEASMPVDALIRGGTNDTLAVAVVPAAEPESGLLTEADKVSLPKPLTVEDAAALGFSNLKPGESIQVTQVRNGKVEVVNVYVLEVVTKTEKIGAENVVTGIYIFTTDDPNERVNQLSELTGRDHYTFEKDGENKEGETYAVGISRVNIAPAPHPLPAVKPEPMTFDEAVNQDTFPWDYPIPVKLTFFDDKTGEAKKPVYAYIYDYSVVSEVKKGESGNLVAVIPQAVKIRWGTESEELDKDTSSMIILKPDEKILVKIEFVYID